MTYPQQPYPPQPGYPPQGFAPQGYAPPAPGYGPPPGYPQQGFAPQGYAPQQPPQAPPVLARGTLEDFLNQAGGGAASVTKFFTDQRVNGHWLQLQISRDLLQSDVRQQTDNNDRPATDRAGNPKFVLVIPVNVLGSSDGSHSAIFTEGVASVWIKGVTKDGLLSAMATAGVPKPDQALLNGHLGGASFVMISKGTRAPQKSGYSATKLYDFQYTPNGREMDVPTVSPELQATANAASPVHAQAPAAAMAPPTPPAPAQVPSGYAPAPPQMQQDPSQWQTPTPGGPAPMNAPAAVATPPAPPAAAPNGYAPQGYPDPAQQYAQAPAAAQGYPPQAPQGYAPPAPPAPQGYAPPQDPEKAALLAKLQGQGG